ncbi:MAG: ATP-dependent Clp protease ATP-binding subunit [Thermoanaerobaculaceae bacterium]|nr:ATP-dependent Clp protease ATP-binding subunit [Thermoanaerobaculaceae bacterium]TAM56769.1 MAG: ATP-dependent Clp protease ATP-binding subunit [Acidobacteriota bacterium]
MLENLTERARRTLFFARYEASQAGASSIAPEHILLGLLREMDDVVEQLLARFSVTSAQLRAELGTAPGGADVPAPGELPLADDARRILLLAAHEAEVLGQPAVGNEHLLLAILRLESNAAARALAAHGLSLAAARDELAEIWREHESKKGKRELTALAEFGRDLTEFATTGGFDPLVGREDEVDRIVQILLRRTKNNPVLLGEPGVGKTAIVEGLAQRIASGRVPVQLAERRIVALDLSLVVAGTKYRGQFEERLKAILKELKENPEIVAFIDELHVLIGAGSAEGSLDAANILKPALSRGEVTCIGATTLKEYRKYIEKDRSLSRRFQPVAVQPPDEAATLGILEGVRERYEEFHRVHYTAAALRAAVEQSGRYITDRFFPDKAIDVLDEAGARVKLRGAASTEELRLRQGEASRVVREMKRAISGKDFEGAVKLREKELRLRGEIKRLSQSQPAEAPPAEVGRSDIEEVISSWTGIPITTLREDEVERLAHMEESLRERIVGQHEAISAIARAIRRSRLGVSRGLRPIGSFLFLGPSGVGKTEAARQLARFLFHSEKALVRFDMSEYMEKHAVSKLIGSPPGYVGFEEGGQLTERVRRQPYSVILLDEIEKSHPEIVNLLLQILEDGILTDAYGDQVDFKNALIVMTSNLGTRDLLAGGASVGFAERGGLPSEGEIRETVMREIKRRFPPEFLNRLDDIVIFHPLQQAELRQVAQLLVADVVAHLASRGITLEVPAGAVEWLVVRAGGDAAAGARPLRRAVARYLEDAMSEYLISHRHSDDDVLLARVEGERLVVGAREVVCEQ